VAHLVLLDHHMVPSDADVARWVDEARLSGAGALRTGALFEPSFPAFLAAGFTVVDRLTLLQLELNCPLDPNGGPDRDVRRSGNGAGTTGPDGAPLPATPHPPRVRRLRASMLDGAAAIDRRAFTPPWGNDTDALRAIMTATPQHRSRCVLDHDGRMIAFSISGRAGVWGYLQRLAVDPDAQQRGLGRLLVDDALRWMRRRRVAHVLVNTAAHNEAALALYRRSGFRTRPDGLAVLERQLAPSASGT
jgi:[ribosomal protein S18]-alanine N-acetyltransferase